MGNKKYEIIMTGMPASAPSSTTPAFLTKLWKMVDDPSTNDLISWSSQGSSFVIHRQNSFAQNLLPFYYKHSNMASFVRQLNMYGFHKVVSVEGGGIKSETCKDPMVEFAHPLFQQGEESLLCKIKRKIPNSPRGSGGQNYSFENFSATKSMSCDKVNNVLVKVTEMRTRQDEMDSKFDNLQKENEALWREVISLRQKHAGQQKIVNKLINFLMSYLQMQQLNQRLNFGKRKSLTNSSSIAYKKDKIEEPSGAGSSNFSIRNGFKNDTQNMQHEIDDIKDLLSDQITLDPNFINSMFNPNTESLASNNEQLSLMCSSSAPESGQENDDDLPEFDENLLLSPDEDNEEPDDLSKIVDGTIGNNPDDFPSIESLLND